MLPTGHRVSGHRLSPPFTSAFLLFLCRFSAAFDRSVRPGRSEDRRASGVADDPGVSTDVTWSRIPAHKRDALSLLHAPTMSMATLSHQNSLDSAGWCRRPTRQSTRLSTSSSPASRPVGCSPEGDTHCCRSHPNQSKLSQPGLFLLQPARCWSTGLPPRPRWAVHPCLVRSALCTQSLTWTVAGPPGGAAVPAGV